MPSWADLVNDLQQKLQTSPQDASRWLEAQRDQALSEIGRLRAADGKPRNVIFYASGWLQKAAPGQYIGVSQEDINGFMSVMRGMDWSAGLTLILHTPGGLGSAAHTIMSYLHTKFGYIEAIVPTYAMSAGTIMALGTDRIVMGRQSQLGPIDAQLQVGAVSVSAAAVVQQFNSAKQEIVADISNAHLWAPILQSLGPSLLQEAQMALAYGEGMAAKWLESRMCAKTADPQKAAKTIAEHFNARDLHKDHGARIDRDEARAKGLDIDDLEADAALQEAVLTAYHLHTIFFETSPATKIISSSQPGQTWMKNLVMQPQPGMPQFFSGPNP